MLSTLAALIAFATGPKPVATLQFTNLSNGSIVGGETDVIYANGKVDFAYQYNDRGRGPKVKGEYQFDKNGLPTRVELKGVDYFKAPVDEHFSTYRGQAQWHSTSEKGKGAATGFYVSNNSCWAEAGFLASALLKAKHPIRLLPGGQASIEKLGDVTVRLKGRKAHVTQYAISGMYFTPNIVWLDDDHQLFDLPGD